MLQPCGEGRSIGRRAQAPTENHDWSKFIVSPSTNKSNKALVPFAGSWLHLFHSKLENMSVPHRQEKRFSYENRSKDVST
jgi:hypothetical protein